MKILFICTHNRCRSILAEAVTNYYGEGILVAKSAGSQPSGKVHPLSLKYLAELGIPTTGLCSQSWNEHESWHPDVVITVCDSAAEESCPVWFGKAIKVHWSLSDPSAIDGDDETVADAFKEIIQKLHDRVAKIIKTDIQAMSKEKLRLLFQETGRL